MINGKPSVLVACEMSGRVRTAFARRGWHAVSCDLLPDESAEWNDAPAGEHYQGDVFDILGEPWDIVIGHPPCDHLSQAGARYWAQKQADGRQQAAAEFFMALYNLPRPEAYVVIENPVGIMNKKFRYPDQIVEPWWFGDPLAKKTCLWYRDRSRWLGRHGLMEHVDRLPDLQPSGAVNPTGRVATGGGSWRTDRLQGKTGMNNWEDSQGRARRHILRSLTPQGFARAAAEQWGSHAESRRA